MQGPPEETPSLLVKQASKLAELAGLQIQRGLQRLQRTRPFDLFLNRSWHPDYRRGWPLISVDLLRRPERHQYPPSQRSLSAPSQPSLLNEGPDGAHDDHRSSRRRGSLKTICISWCCLPTDSSRRGHATPLVPVQPRLSLRRAARSPKCRLQSLRRWIPPIMRTGPGSPLLSLQ